MSKSALTIARRPGLSISRGPKEAAVARTHGAPDAQVQAVRRLVGNITAKQYRHVDVALAQHLGVFTPISGACEYAISPAHTHPSYSFIISFDGSTRVLLDGRVLSARPGDLSAVAPDVPHQELPGDAPPRYAAVMIAPKYLGAVRK